MDFIDEHCLEFDDDQEEHKLLHTELHQKFCELVDALLEVHLADISLSAEDFMAVLMKSPAQSELRSIVMEQIMAVDDFLTFKKLMVKRARELRVLQLEKAVSDRAGLAAASDPDLQEALRRSEAEVGGVGTPTAEAKALQQALEASQAEWADLERARAALEIAQLEAAIAASLAMEEQRLAMIAQDREKERERQAREAERVQPEAAPAPAHTPAYPPLPAVPTSSFPPLRAAAPEPYTGSLPSLSSASTASLPALSNKRAPVLSGADREELEALLGGSSGLKNEEEVEAARRRADEVFERNKARLADLDVQGGAGRGGGMGEDALEIARRKKHLAELRDQLRASKAQQHPSSPAQGSGALPPVRPPAGGGGAAGTASPDEVSRRQALAAKIRAEMSL